MNLLIFTEQDVCGEHRIRISGRRFDHLMKTLRVKVGDQIRVGELGGLCGSGTIEHITQDCAELAVSVQQTPPPKLPTTLVLALPRPKMLRRILRACAEYGVSNIHLINSYKVEKSFWQTPLLNQPSLETYLLQGLEQASDTLLPSVSLHQRFKPFAEDLLPTLCEGKSAVVAHPGDYPVYAPTSENPSVLVIGPEGGFIPYEVELCQAAGCEAVSLGPRVLRVESAVAAAIGAQAILLKR